MNDIKGYSHELDLLSNDELVELYVYKHMNNRYIPLMLIDKIARISGIFDTLNKILYNIQYENCSNVRQPHESRSNKHTRR